MFADHKIATSVGSVGAAVILGHVMLGPAIIPPAVAVPGAGLLAIAGVYLPIARRRVKDRA